MQLMQLVQRHLEHAADDLHRPRQAAGRSQDQGQALRRDAAGRGCLLDQSRRRALVHFQHQAGALRLIGIAQFLEQRLLAGKRASRAGAQRIEGLLALAMAEAPARELAARQASTGSMDPTSTIQRPALEAAIRGDPHLAEPAHADLGDPAPGLDAAGTIDAGIDDGSARLAALDGDAQGLGIADQPFDQGDGQEIHARPRHRCHPVSSTANRSVVSRLPSPAASASRTRRLRVRTSRRADGASAALGHDGADRCARLDMRPRCRPVGQPRRLRYVAAAPGSNDSA